MKLRSRILVGAIAAAAIAGSANATVLLNLTNPAATTTPYALTFVATEATTTLYVAGYQVPSFEQAYGNGVYANGSQTNLLVQTWDYTQAASGSLSDQYSDGTSVNELNFGGITVGSYDTYYQTFATTVGQTYTYDFNFEEDYGGPSSFIVSTDMSPVPEPGVWALMLAGLGGLGATLRSRRKVALSAI